MRWDLPTASALQHARKEFSAELADRSSLGSQYYNDKEAINNRGQYHYIPGEYSYSLRLPYTAAPAVVPALGTS